jgi:hypothetical protein
MRCKGTTFFGKKNIFAFFLLKKMKKSSFFAVLGQKAPVFIFK